MTAEPAETIRNLELELLDPETRKSPARLNELIGDEFVEFGESGKRYIKHEVLKDLPGSDLERYTMEGFEVRPLAADSVLATYRLRKENNRTGVISWSWRSSVWRLQRGRWQIVFHQGTRAI